jgi:hypothetical protein
MKKRPDVILKHGAPAFLRAWVGALGGASPSIDDVVKAVKRDQQCLGCQMKLVAKYADTVAHLQHVGADGSGEIRIKGKAISEALAVLRRQVNVYRNLIVGEFPPDLGQGSFVAAFGEEVGRLIPFDSSESD